MSAVFWPMFTAILYMLIAVDLIFPLTKRKYDKVCMVFGGACLFLSGMSVAVTCIQAGKILNF